MRPSNGMFWISTSRPREFAEGVGQVHADAGWRPLGIRHFERRIGQFHADDELIMRLARAAVEEAEERGEDGIKAFHQRAECGDMRG